MAPAPCPLPAVDAVYYLLAVVLVLGFGLLAIYQCTRELSARIRALEGGGTDADMSWLDELRG